MTVRITTLFFATPWACVVGSSHDSPAASVPATVLSHHKCMCVWVLAHIAHTITTRCTLSPSQLAARHCHGYQHIPHCDISIYTPRKPAIVGVSLYVRQYGCDPMAGDACDGGVV